MPVATIISFLVLLNPFAIFLYLGPIMQDLSHKQFARVLLQATIMSYMIYAIFLLTGTLLFQSVLQISFEAFRIFGGVIIFSFAYLYIIRGQAALIHMKEDLNDLASEIAIPFMVGAATISLAVLMSQQYEPHIGLLLLTLIMVLFYIIIMLLKSFRDSIHEQHMKVAFDKNMGILMRLNGFFLGAIGVNMMLEGIRNAFF